MRSSSASPYQRRHWSLQESASFSLASALVAAQIAGGASAPLVLLYCLSWWKMTSYYFLSLCLESYKEITSHVKIAAAVIVTAFPLMDLSVRHLLSVASISLGEDYCREKKHNGGSNPIRAVVCWAVSMELPQECACVTGHTAFESHQTPEKVVFKSITP